MKENSHLMAHQSSAKPDGQVPFQPLKLLKKPHPSEDDYIEQDGPFMSTTCSLHDDEDEDDDKDDPQHPFASTACPFNTEEIALQETVSPPVKVTEESIEPNEVLAEDSGRERLKRRRVEVAGRVWIPDIWGQEELLKDWIDCSAFDAPLVPSRIMTARAALVEEGRRANARRLRIENRC